MDLITTLYKSLNQRKRPEDIAEMILSLVRNQLSKAEIRTLEKASKGSLKNKFWGYTSMLQDFANAVGAEKQVKKAIELFHLEHIEQQDYNNFSNIENFIETVAPLIHKSVGANNFLSDRLSRFERIDLGLDISKRQYNKKWRLLKRIEKKLIKFGREQQKINFQKIAKHGIVHQLDFENFSADLNTACFIAYYNARCNLRSTFTNQSQTRPFDVICELLFKRCKKATQTETNWLAISYIYTSDIVLKNLSDPEKGALLGAWTNILKDIASLLGQIWNASVFHRKTMIVQRGNDSTTWNNTAGAWNKARDHWINLIYALGMDDILDEICFGKVMRLMAADVAYWHRASGGKLDPNTIVWNKLPLPWQVFNQTTVCTKNMVIQACKKAGIDPETSGWITPRTHGVAPFTSTPELVHGVSISNPFLATFLKQNKVFSGKAS